MPTAKSLAPLFLHPSPLLNETFLLGHLMGALTWVGAVFAVAGHHGQGARETGEAAPQALLVQLQAQSAGMSAPVRNIHPLASSGQVCSAGPRTSSLSLLPLLIPLTQEQGLGGAQDYS